MAVTKTWPAEVARAALDAGLSRLGESRVQEAEPKVAALPHAEWHLVGRLQDNKARRAVRAFAILHSIDSAALLTRVERVAAEEGRSPQVLLQVNLSGVATTAGMSVDQVVAPDMLDAIGSVGSVTVTGLMTIARLGADEVEARSTFAALRTLSDRLRDATGLPLDELSMGMSADADAAAAEGATLVRIGTALFGPRA